MMKVSMKVAYDNSNIDQYGWADFTMSEADLAASEDVIAKQMLYPAFLAAFRHAKQRAARGNPQPYPGSNA